MWNKKICLATIVTLALACNASMGDTVTALEGYWPLDSDAQDFSGNEHHGTLIGDAHFVDNGVFGGALELDGDGDFVSMDGYKGILQSPWTLACWINTTSAGDADIVSWGTEGGGLKVEFRLNAGLLRIEHGNGNNRGDVPVNDGQWHHGVAALPEGGLMEDVYFYVDGEPVGTFAVGNGTNPFLTTAGIDFNIGRSGPRGDRFFPGLIDEVRIYNRELSQDDIKEAMETSAAGMNPVASGPIPADSAIHEDTWVNLGWKPGAFAVSHDVYIGDVSDDVNEATRNSELFRGNQTLTFYIAGFPGFAYPDGLVPGTTYYWRIDEINDSEPNSPWKGDLWSFTVPPRIAYDPAPADGVKLVDPGVTLSWKAGMNTKLHHVYFGDDFDQVNDATGALSQIGTTYSPGALEPDKTYYWRVDEFDGAVMHKGDVWSFTTLPDIGITDPNLLAWLKLDETGGATAVDWSGHASHGILRGTAQWVVPGQVGEAALTFGQNGYVAIRNLTYEGTGYTASTVACWMRTTNPGTQIIASFGRADYWRLGLDNFGAGAGLIDWDVMTNNGQVDHGSLTRVDDGAWHHVCCVFDRGRMSIYIDGREDSTMTGAPTFGSGQTRYGFLGADSLAASFDGARDRFVPLVGDIDDFRIYDKVLVQDEITQIMRGDPLVAWNPNPANASNPDIDSALPLTWSPGDNASQHEVYFGTNKDVVDNTDNSDTTGIFRGRQNATSYTPPESVEWDGGPYYWRVDEINIDGTIKKGTIWSFTVADFILVDDFESYTDNDADGEAIWQAWIDGFDIAGNGAQVGYLLPPYAEQTTVHSGYQSMPFLYDNTTGVTNSEALLALTSPRDWTRHNVTNLSMWFHGDPANSAEPMYVSISNTTGSPAVAAHTDPIAATMDTWTEWRIPLQEFTNKGINLRNVDKIAIGFGRNAGTITSGGSGMVYFDDIRLYRD